MLIRTRHGSVRVAAVILMSLLIASCGGDSSPMGPSEVPSFLTGTWRGTMTISRTGEPDVTGPTAWTFQPAPQQPGGSAFQATIESQNPWLPITMISTTALGPSPTPPTQINSYGTYASPRGCRGDFGSAGDVQSRTIDATFFGVDCNDQTFQGRVQLTKQ